jgi:hypothetical protein
VLSERTGGDGAAPIARDGRVSDYFARVSVRFVDAFGDGEVASQRAGLVPVFTTQGDPKQVARLRPVFLGDPAGVDALAEAIMAVLADGLPRTGREVAKGVRRRKVDVEALLARDRRFMRVPAPHDRSRRARTWTLAPEGEGPVGTTGERGT